MGTEAVWVPLVLAAVSSTAAYVNQRNVAHKQDQQLAAQLRSQADKQREADAKTAQLIQSEAQSSDKQDKAKSLAGYNQAMAMKAPTALASLSAPGAVSGAYNKAKSDAALGVTSYGSNFADNVASIDAPNQQRQRDAINLGRYSTDIGQIGRFNRGDDFLANMRLRSIKPSPFLSLVQGVAGGASSAMAGGYGTGTAAAASGTPYAYPNLQNNLPDTWGYIRG